MRRARFLLFLATCCVAIDGSAETALKALRALPKADRAKVLQMEGVTAEAAPASWRFQVQDAQVPGGLRDIVVSGGEIVSDHDAAANSAAASEARVPIKTTALKIDSDKAAQLARRTAAQSGYDNVSLRCTLHQADAKAVPIWVITCGGDDGREVGTIVITATRGDIVAHDGFISEAPPATTAVDPNVVESDRRFLSQENDKSAPSTGEIDPERPVDTVATSPPEPIAEAPIASSAPEPPDRESTPARERTSRGHSHDITISPVREIKRATAPVRRIVRRVLPF